MRFSVLVMHVCVVCACSQVRGLSGERDTCSLCIALPSSSVKFWHHLRTCLGGPWG